MIFSVDKKIFSIAIITLCLVTRISSLVYDIIAYSKYVFNILYPVGIVKFNLDATGPSWLANIYSLSDLAFSIFLILLTISYFKTRTTSYVAYTIVTILFGVFATSILVFATRNRDALPKKFYVYVNNQPTQNSSNNQKPFSEFSTSEPFSEFKKEDLSEPFSEFSNGNLEEKNATDFVQEQDNKNTNKSNDDDMF